MADTQVKLTSAPNSSAPNSSAEDLKKHLLKIFKDVTKDTEDKQLRRLFDTVVDYDALNAQAMYMFSGVAECYSLDEARELFKPLPDQVTLPEVAVFTMVIVAYIRARKTMDARKVYQQMIATGVTPASFTYSSIISALAEDFSDSNFVGYAKKYFLEMLDKGMKPPYKSYMSVMAAIKYREPEEEENKFLEQIKAKGFIPEKDVSQNHRDVLTKLLQVTYTCADFDRMINTLDKDVQKFVQKSHASPANLSKWTMKMFNTMNNDGNDIEAVMFASQIQGTRTEPAVVFHTLVIEAYLKFGKIKGALEAYVAMLFAGVAPNSVTYTLLIKGLAADPEFFEDAKMYLLEMMDKGKRPNVATYTAVIEGFAKLEDKAAEEEGKEFVEVMMGMGFVPNAKAMREVLKGRPIPLIRRIMNIVLSKLKG